MAPETHYAKKGDISIAYQVVGDGPIDLVLVNGILSHMALLWTDPQANAMLRRITSFARLIMFDKPGTGLSDPVSGPPSTEQRVEDIRVVMDAVGLEHAALWGYSEGGSPSMLFAATYPERCDALILLETAAKWISDPDYFPDEAALEPLWTLFSEGGEKWGDGHVILDLWAPSAMSVPGSLQFCGSAERICASPGMAKAVMWACTLIDVRAALPRISVPTLVVNREDSFVPIELGRYLAQEIPGAKHAVFPGQDHVVWWGTGSPSLTRSRSS